MPAASCFEPMTTTTTPRFDAMLAALKEKAGALEPEFARFADGDNTLIQLFERHRKAVSEHFESCVPDGQPWMKWNPSTCPRNEIHGPYFHKGFRQWDVTGSAEDDIAIWKLLARDTTNFWDAHQASMKDGAA